jgi:hypothetical protein
MERMTMHTADRLVLAAAARLRAFAELVSPSAVPAPCYVSATGASTTQHIQGWSMFDGKPGTTGGFRLNDHPARRQPERSP